MESEVITNSSCLYKLKVVSGVLFGFLVFGGIFMALLSLKKSQRSGYCITQACIQQAINMQESLDKSVNPCQNFYNFTCGNFMKDKDQIGQLNFELQIRPILYRERANMFVNKSRKLISPAENLKAFYNVCVGLESSGTNYKRRMIDILLQFKWPPLIKNWNDLFSTNFNWLDLEGELIRMGLRNSFFEFTTFTDARSRRKPSRLMLSCTSPVVPRHFFDLLSEENTINSFIEIVRRFIKSVDGDENLADEIVHTFVEIERIKLQGETVDKRFGQNKKLTILRGIPLGIIDKHFKIGFTKFCSSIFPSFMNISKNTVINFNRYCPAHLINLLERTNKRSLAGYMLWEVARDLLWIVSDETRDFNNQIRSLFFLGKVSLNKTCDKFIMEFLPDLASYIYVKTYFSEEKRNRIVGMVNLILEEAKYLVKYSWLKSSTKNMVFKKISKMKYVTDHVDRFVTDQYIRSTHGKLKIDTSNLMKSTMNIKMHRFAQKWKQFLWSYENRSLANVHPNIIEYFYNRAANTLVIPASMTVGVLYSNDLEAYSNFAGLGTIIGHQVFHSIASTSKMFDDNLNVGNRFRDREINIFNNKTRCFIHQYDNYHLTQKLRVNGTNTLEENLADAGILLSYRAYLKWLKKNQVKKLPGFGNYNKRQLFWIVYGNLWCEKYNEQYFEDVYFANEIRGIAKFRVIGSLSNIKEFSQAFNCPKNANMNPKNKCTLYH